MALDKLPKQVQITPCETCGHDAIERITGIFSCAVCGHDTIVGQSRDKLHAQYVDVTEHGSSEIRRKFVGFK